MINALALFYQCLTDYEVAGLYPLNTNNVPRPPYCYLAYRTSDWSGEYLMHCFNRNRAELTTSSTTYVPPSPSLAPWVLFYPDLFGVLSSIEETILCTEMKGSSTKQDCVNLTDKFPGNVLP